MKRALVFASIMLMFLITDAQSLKVIYKEIMDVSEQLESIDDPTIRKMVQEQLSKPVQYELTSSQGVSVYQQVGEEESMEQGNISVHIPKNEDISYQNLNKKIQVEQKYFMSRQFLIEEPLKNYDWELSQETLKIGSYLCRKATLKNPKDEPVTAWFTMDVPTNFGPRMYYGLPGLIIKLESGDLKIEAVKITPSKESLNLERPNKGKHVSEAEFDKIVREKTKSMQKGGGVTIIEETF